MAVEVESAVPALPAAKAVVAVAVAVVDLAPLVVPPETQDLPHHQQLLIL